MVGTRNGGWFIGFLRLRSSYILSPLAVAVGRSSRADSIGGSPSGLSFFRCCHSLKTKKPNPQKPKNKPLKINRKPPKTPQRQPPKTAKKTAIDTGNRYRQSIQAIDTGNRYRQPIQATDTGNRYRQPTRTNAHPTGTTTATNSGTRQGDGRAASTRLF